MSRLSFAPLSGATLLLLASMSPAVSAQSARTPADSSRITGVKVYPGSATVEREARVAAGARSVVFSCLPASLDARSLQVSAPDSVRIGELSVATVARAVSPECATGDLDARIRSLEAQKDTLGAEAEALGLVTGYLKEASTTDTAGRRPTLDPRQIAAVAEALQRTGQQALLKQRQVERAQAEVQARLAALLAQRGKSQGSAEVLHVTVSLAAAAEAGVRLSYQVNGPSWQPAYRALLDSRSGVVRIERQALVAQSTGEDWRGVKLLLSTGQPRAGTAGPLPQPWRVGIDAPVAADMRTAASPRFAAAPVMSLERARADAPPPDFEVTVQDNAFATEFTVPQAIDVPSSGQRVALALGEHQAPAERVLRTSPRQDPSAYLIASMPVPPGVWPAGPMQLYRDGAFVGSSRWSTPDDTRLELSFGRDELLRVEVDPETDSTGTTGLTGSRTERRIGRAYRLENRHPTPVTVQVLEAAPVAVDEQVRVNAAFTPQPAELAWRRQPGVAMWTVPLPPRGQARLTANYVISHPKDTRLSNE